MATPKRPMPTRIVIDFARNRAEELAELQARTRILVSECLAHNRAPDPERLRKLGLSGQRAFFQALLAALRRDATPAPPPPAPAPAVLPVVLRAARPARAPDPDADCPGVIATPDWPERRRRRAAPADRVFAEACLLASLLTSLAVFGLHLVPHP